MKNKIFAVVLATTQILTASIATAQAQNTLKAEINPAVKFQTIEYFGASDAWSTQYIGDYWDDAAKEKIAKLLFSQKCDSQGNPEGIGLSLWRVNLGGGTLEGDKSQIDLPWRAARSFMPPEANSPDWSRCKGAKYFMAKARELGCNNFLLFSNSPLIQFTKNGRGYAAKIECNLKPEDSQKFADYLADCAKYFTDEGFCISYISPINEPQMFWTTSRQEGSPWFNSDMKRMFVDLNGALEKRKLDSVKILVGECADLKTTYQDAGKWYTSKWNTEKIALDERPDEQIRRFFSPESKFYVGNLKHVAKLIGAHSYHSHLKNDDMKEVRSKVKDEAKKYGIDFHQTEWCMLGSYRNPKNMDGFTQDWTSENLADSQVALHMAKLICADLVYGEAKSWSYWVATEIKNGLCALIETNPKFDDTKKPGTIRPNKLLWALGNYSFFIRPDFKRIELKGGDDYTNVAASAFESKEGKRIVAVFVNMDFADKKLDAKLTSPKKIKSCQTYITSERLDLAPTRQIFPKSLSTADIAIPARSICTLVIDFM